MTFQVEMGDVRFYVIGVYIPPDCRTGVDDLRRAWDACPQGCKPIVLGGDEREEIIVDLLNKINLIDSSCRF